MSQTTRRSLLKTLGVGGTVFAFGAGAGYAQTDSGSAEGAEGVTLPPSDDTALLRALHASPDAPAVDVYVDGEQVAQGLEFGNITGYLELSPGAVEVQVYPSEAGGEDTTGTENETTTEAGATVENETTANATAENATVENETTTDSDGLGTETEMGSSGQTPSGDPLIDETVTVEGGESYTVAAINQLDEISALVLEDEPEDDYFEGDDSNTAIVRAVHLSPDAPTVKVRADSHVVAGALEYEEASDYADVQPGNTQVEVLPTGSADPVETATYDFEGGERYNLFLIGMVDPEAAAAEGGVETETGNETTTEAGAGMTNATAENETVANETTVNATAENETVANETTVNATAENATVGNETTANATAENATVENETVANETTTEAGGMTNETTTEAGGMTNETTTEAGAGGSENQTQPEAFQILAVQDGTGTVLEEAEDEGTPSADDLLPIDLSDGNDSDGNATTENETVANETTANETTANGTAANGTVTEANNTTTSN